MSQFTNTRNLKIKPVFTIGAENAGAGTINVAIQLINRDNGNEISEAVAMFWYLSADAAGQTIATAHSGGAAIGTDGFLIEWTANLSGLVISEADGDIDITFTEAGALTTYLNLVAPDGKVYTSGAITHAA